MKIKKFSELTIDQINYLVEIHFNHWVKFNPKLNKQDTNFKFKNLYTTEQLPFGIALIDEFEQVVGFCVLKLENLKKYPQIFPWLSDVMIVEQFRGKGYGKILLNFAEQILKKYGYNEVYVWTDQTPDFYKRLGFEYKQEVVKNEGGFGQLFYKKL